MSDLTDPAVTAQFDNVTESGGQEVSAEQLERSWHRYRWAADFARDKDVLEAACGAGQGLGMLAEVARSLRAGDVSEVVLEHAIRTYNTEVKLAVFSADSVPMPDSSLDIVLLFEALYYLPDADAFVTEAQRVLRPGGTLLIVTANKDLFDFTPSPFSTRYYGVKELFSLLNRHTLEAKFWGYTDVGEVSFRQKLFRPAKYLANRLGLMPKTMASKALFKRLVFGKTQIMPQRIARDAFTYVPPVSIDPGRPNHDFKVIYCQATMPPEIK